MSPPRHKKKKKKAIGILMTGVGLFITNIVKLCGHDQHAIF